MAFNAGGQLSATQEAAALNAIFRNTTFSLPATVYVALSTAAPTATDGTGLAEPTIGTGGYARVAVTTGSGGGTGAVFGAPAAGGTSGQAITNGSTVSFPASTAAWSTGSTPNTWFSLWLTSSGTTAANFVGAGPLQTGQAVNASGITLSFASGQLTITLT